MRPAHRSNSCFVVKILFRYRIHDIQGIKDIKDQRMFLNLPFFFEILFDENNIEKLAVEKVLPQDTIATGFQLYVLIL